MNQMLYNLLCKLSGSSANSSELLQAILTELQNATTLLNDDHITLEPICVLIDNTKSAIVTPVVQMREGKVVGVSYLDELGGSITGSVSLNPDPCNCMAECKPCDPNLFKNCFEFMAFDTVHAFTPGMVTEYRIKPTTAGAGSVLVDYASNLVNGSYASMYKPLVDYINNNVTGWKLEVVKDVLTADTNGDGVIDTTGKALWRMTYTGSVPSTVDILKNNDLYRFVADPANAQIYVGYADGHTPFGTPAQERVVAC